MTKSPGSHHHHHGHHRKPPLCQEDSPEKPQYRNVKPKVGHQYQTKVPKQGSALSSRPPPLRYSTEIPHLTEQEIKNETKVSLPNSIITMTTTAGYGPMQTTVPSTVRGGLLVHKPRLGTTNDYLHATRGSFFLPPSHWNLPSNNNGRRKRKHSNMTLETAPPKECPPLEQDESYLHYLQLRHHGNVDTAQLALLVASGAGRAYRTRRAMHQQDHVERFRRPPLTSSQSWYERLDRECPLLDKNSMASSPQSDDDKRVWKVVLHSAQEMQRELEHHSTSQPLLSHSVQLVRNARQLPPPEDSFGTRHIVVEGISEAMHEILNHVTKAHDAQAKLLDMLYDEMREGVDMEAVSKYMKELESSLSIRLDVMNVVEKQLKLASQWKDRKTALDRDVLVADDNDDLQQFEQLLRDASELGICWRQQVELEERVQKAYQLRDRLREWQQLCASGTKESFKFVSNLVRDATRLNINFPEVSELLRFHQTAEQWVERANVAVRSRISLTEIESLVDRAEKMPLDLSEFTSKLQSRIRQSQSWISEFQDLVPAPFVDGKVDNLAWMSRMRKALQDADKHFSLQLHDIAMEGTRIPVEIDCVKLLLVEIDAKDWSQKAVKWIPNDLSDDEEGVNGGKRAKLVDIRDHLDKAETLRERIVLSEEESDAWVLEGEAELQAIIDAADDWYQKYQEYLEYDNRRNHGDRSCLSLATLRQIVEEGNLIHANIGSASGKMTRILGQAEAWYEEYGSLLTRCGVTASVAPSSIDKPKGLPPTLEEIKAAVESAESNISLDVDEARSLRDLSERIQKWQERVVLAAPKRSKRVGKGKGTREETRYTVNDLLSLIDESSSLPIMTDEDAERLRQQLSKVREWRIQARLELGDIATSFRALRQAITSDYGLPDEFYDEETREHGSNDAADDVPQDAEAEVSEQSQGSQARPLVPDQSKEAEGDGEGDSAMTMDSANNAQESTEASSQTDASSQADSEIDMEGGGSAVCKMTSSLLKNAKLTGVKTAEEEMIELLDKTAKWVLRSLKCIDSPKDVYERKSFRPFDEFIATGEELLAYRDSLQGLDLDDAELLHNLGSSSGDLVSDQLARLNILRTHRDKYIAWVKNAQQVISSKEDRVTLDAVNELLEQSRDFPAASDMVQKVRHVAQRAQRWKEAAKKLFDSDEKPTMQEARELLEASDKLNLMCDEVNVLRNAVRAARAWANRVKRCKVDEGGANSGSVTKLLQEHETLLLSMPNEFSKLNQALRGYCLCRQPYDGFMIGCDGCGEWYHGPCVGVSEARADKWCDKFLCVRCSLKRTFTTSASTIATVIRNWSDPNELKKTRQHEAQKHQRKVRKEKRDIENLASKTETLAAELALLEAHAGQERVSEEEEQNPGREGVAVAHDSENKVKDIVYVPDDQSKPLETESSGISVQMNCSSAPVAPEASSVLENLDPLIIRKREIEAELNRATESVKANGNRLAELNIIASERKQREDREDAKKAELRRWCIRVRSLVLVPCTMEAAASSLPSSDGSLSAPMVKVVEEAMILGIHELPVVLEVENAFKCIAWCCFAMPLLARQPSLQEVNTIIRKGAGLKLPEVMPMRMLKSMAQRAKTWQTRAVKALAPKPRETEPVSVDTLKGLVQAATDIPLSIPGEASVQNVVEDKGARYCICGGPHIGSFMLGCDRCDRWYHGRCVHIKSKDSDALDNWVCPPCRGIPPPVGPPHFSVNDLDYTDDEAEAMSDDEENAIHAPIPEKLWPPFGLLKSPEAVAALGEKCCAIEDDTGSLTTQSLSMFANGHAPSMLSSAFGTGGVSLQASQTVSTFNPYTFGSSLPNGTTAPQAVFANALADRASSILSSSAALTSAHVFGGLASASKGEAANDGSSVHGFHGFGTANSATDGFRSFGASRESSSSTNASSENLGSATPASASPVEGLDEDEKKLSPSMNWQPPIMQAASSDSNGVAREQPLVNSSAVQNGVTATTVKVDVSVDASSSDAVEHDATPDIPMEHDERLVEIPVEYKAT